MQPMAGNPPTPPYDPMTPSLDDYKAAQGELNQAITHDMYVHTQSKDPNTYKQAHDAAIAASQKVSNIRQKLIKAGKMK